jgi:hypothetical protein
MSMHIKCINCNTNQNITDGFSDERLLPYELLYLLPRKVNTNHSNNKPQRDIPAL